MFTPPAGFRLGPDAVAWVHPGKGSQQPSEFYWGQRRSVWNNPASGDTATLRNRAGVFVDTAPCGL